MASPIWLSNLREAVKGREQVARLFRRDVHGHNRGLVVTGCLITASCLWLLLSLGDAGELRVELQTSIINPVLDSAFVKLPPQSVMASVEADVLELLKLKYLQRPVFTINASRGVINAQEAVDWPLGVVATFDSPQIRLKREARIRKTVPIVSRVTVHPAPKYWMFEPPAIAPDSVVVTGASSIISDIEFWPTVAMHQYGVKDALTVEVPLMDSLEGLVTRTYDQVTLTARTDEFTEGSRHIRVDVTDVPNAQNIVDLDPPEVMVRFHAPLPHFRAILWAEDFLATVPYEAIRLDTTGTVVPRITVPTNYLIRLVDTAPKLLRYYVSTSLY